MANTLHRLPLERPIYALEDQIAGMEAMGDRTPDAQERLRQMRRELTELKKRIFGELTAWESVEVARHPDRPMTTDYLGLAFDEFVELHGDKSFGDDRAIRAGFAKLDRYKVMVIGHQKGKTHKERNACHFGCAHPEGYRKAMLKMRLAEKYKMPVICLIDTPGAYPGIGAEERGQAQVIAESMFQMSQLQTPIVCAVIGEGGSGGALGIGVGDRVAVLEFAYYSVISPEGCAAILWRDSNRKMEAAAALKLTAPDLLGFGIIDEIVPEPVGGAQRDPDITARSLKEAISRRLAELSDLPTEKLLARRFEKFRSMGAWQDRSEKAEKTADKTPAAPRRSKKKPS